jgi:hypothetical protein
VRITHQPAGWRVGRLRGAPGVLVHPVEGQLLQRGAEHAGERYPGGGAQQAVHRLPEHECRQHRASLKLGLRAAPGSLPARRHTQPCRERGAPAVSVRTRGIHSLRVARAHCRMELCQSTMARITRLGACLATCDRASSSGSRSALAAASSTPCQPENPNPGEPRVGTSRA